MAALNGEVWSVGGAWSEAGQTRTTVEVYSPRLNTWRVGVPLPLARVCGSCVVVQC